MVLTQVVHKVLIGVIHDQVGPSFLTDVCSLL